ncbi:Ribosomal RNA-processing protein 7 A [Phlyctochytrium planicorne]|nr:Ribosomal RNA-processing protein 7 A [Phlyctochytrium planicorne]
MTKVGPIPAESPAVSSSTMSLMSLSGIVCDIADDSKLAADQESTKMFLSTVRELYKEDNVDVFNDQELAKFLIAQKGHMGKAMSALAETLAWRKSFGVDKTLMEEDFKDLDGTGKAQFFGRARDGTPILVINLSRHTTPKDAPARDREIRYIVYVLERARQDGILMDKMTVIVDRANITSGQSDTTVIKTVIPILQKHYPECLSRMIIFPTNTWFWMFWRVAKVFIDQATVPKIELKDGPTSLFANIDAQHLFERYGGIHKDPYDSLPVESNEKETVENTSEKSLLDSVVSSPSTAHPDENPLDEKVTEGSAKGASTPSRNNSAPPTTSTPSSTKTAEKTLRNRASSFRLAFWGSSTPAAAAAAPTNLPASTTPLPPNHNIAHSPAIGPAATSSNPVTITMNPPSTNLAAGNSSVFSSLKSTRSMQALRTSSAPNPNTSSPLSPPSGSSQHPEPTMPALHPGAFQVVCEEIWSAPEEIELELAELCSNSSSPATVVATSATSTGSSGPRQFYGIGVRKASTQSSNVVVKPTSEAERKASGGSTHLLSVATDNVSEASQHLSASTAHGDGRDALSPSPVSFISSPSDSEHPDHSLLDSAERKPKNFENDDERFEREDENSALPSVTAGFPRRGHFKEETTESEILEMLDREIKQLVAKTKAAAAASKPKGGSKLLVSKAEKIAKRKGSILQAALPALKKAVAKQKHGLKGVASKASLAKTVKDDDEDEDEENEDGDEEEENENGMEDNVEEEDELNGDLQNGHDDDHDDDDDEDEDEDQEDEHEDEDEEEEAETSKKQSKNSPSSSKPKSKASDDQEDGQNLQKVNGFILLPITMPPINILPLPFIPFTKHLTSEEATKIGTLTPVIHHLLFRLHTTKASDADRFPKGRTLFLTNVPSDASERHFKRLFRRCGRVERVVFAKRGEGATVGMSGGQAHVVFFEEEAAQRALHMKARKRNWSDALVEGTEDEEETAPYLGQGMEKWVAQYAAERPRLEDLEKSVNKYMEEFEEMEAEKERALAARRNQPDEDGFILVTKGAGRKGKAASDVAVEKGAKKNKKTQVVDFYRFQMREGKRNQLAELRKKFEEDKARIEEMKARRKFKPNSFL